MLSYHQLFESILLLPTSNGKTNNDILLPRNRPTTRDALGWFQEQPKAFHLLTLNDHKKSPQLKSKAVWLIWASCIHHSSVKYILCPV